jgi:hypothetical protein
MEEQRNLEGGNTMSVHGEIEKVAEEIKHEINEDIDLTIGSLENPAEAVPTLCERMDRICAMMNYQATLISYAETALEEAKYKFKKKELAAKKKYSESFVKYKQEDRLRPKADRRTDPEYCAIAELESNIEVNEALSSEREYMHAQHGLEDAKHKYEILNNHFLSYRKACDMLVKEMNKLGPRIPSGGF